LTQRFQEICEAVERGEACALATLVSTSGSSPQNTGAKLLVLQNRRILGTIGGGCMEAEARRVALDSLRKRKPVLFSLRLDDDFGWDDGLICGGKVDIFINPLVDRSADIYRKALEAANRRDKTAVVTILTGKRAGASCLTDADGNISGECAPEFEAAVRAAALEGIELGREARKELAEGVEAFIEPILPRPTLLIAGAGHIGSAMAQIASLCGFEVVVVDDRPSFANRDRLPWADRVVVDDIPTFVRDFRIDRDTYVAIVTRGHRHDAQVLRECVRSEARYVGMIGSKRKIVVIFEEMIEQGLATREELLRVRSPMGLTIGDREVGEIAVSIMAEIVAVRNGADLDAVRTMPYSPPFLRSELTTAP
jgi:xanthine dehydrogenase accessory factor